jgi:hypothetical protein
LENYLNDLLDPAARTALERHAAECRSCDKALQEAMEAQRCVSWLKPSEPPPEAGVDFYYRVHASIEKELSRSWLIWLSAAMRPRLAYPLVFLGLLLGAWAFTQEIPLSENEGLMAMEFPDQEFARMLAGPTADGNIGRDLVMMNLVGLPEEAYRE